MFPPLPVLHGDVVSWPHRAGYLRLVGWATYSGGSMIQLPRVECRLLACQNGASPDCFVFVVVVVVLCMCVWRCGAPAVCTFETLPVSTFDASPCVPATRPHVWYMWTFCQYTPRRFECTHGRWVSSKKTHVELSLARNRWIVPV